MSGQGLPAPARHKTVKRIHISDDDLARAASDGDGAAFSTLLARHYDRLFGLAFRMTGSRADAEDLTQDVCAALPSKIRSFRAESRFTTWMYRIMVNAAHDLRRRRAAHDKASEGWGDWELARRDEAKETAEQVDWLIATMRALPDELRDTLALILDDATHRQAAEVLGISEGTVSWRIYEAKRHLAALRAKEDRA